MFLFFIGKNLGIEFLPQRGKYVFNFQRKQMVGYMRVHIDL